MANIRNLDIEQRLKKEVSNIEFKKDKELVRKIAETLPSSAKVRIHKRLDDGSKAYVTTVNAESFPTDTPYEWIKNKYYERYGGGDYIVELLDGNNNVVGTYEVNILGEPKPSSAESEYAKAVQESVSMREAAMEKMKEAEKELREAEKTKYESTLDIINKHWESVTKMYEARLQELKEKQKDSPEVMRTIVDMEIRDLENKLERATEKFQEEVRRLTEKKESSDKVFDLMNNLVPAILEKSFQKGRDPVEEFKSMYTVVNEVTGGRKDMLESMIEDPRRLEIFKKIVGISENGDARRDFFTELIENPQKAEVFKKIMGVEEKKDWLTDIIENPNKFEILKRVMGVEDDKKDSTQIPVETKKEDMLEQIIEISSKLSQAKPVLMNLLGVQQQPVRSFLEFLGTLVTNAGPYIVKAVESVGKSMIIKEMINKGIIKDHADLSAIEHMVSGEPIQYLSGYSGMQEHAKPISSKIEEPETSSRIEKPEKVNLSEEFKNMIIEVASSHENPAEPMDGNEFINKLSSSVVDFIKKHPSLIIKFSNESERENISKTATAVFKQTLGLDDSQAEVMTVALENAVAYKLFGKIIHNAPPFPEEEEKKGKRSKKRKEKEQQTIQQ